MEEKIHIDVDRVRTLYESGTNIQDIAKELGCNQYLVVSRIKKYNIKKGNKFDFLDKECLKNLYLTQKLSLREIANRTGATPSNVRIKLKKFGISIRPSGGRQVLDEQKMINLYCNEGRTCKEIASLMGVSSSTIQKRLNSCGVQLKDSGKRKGSHTGCLKDVDYSSLERLYLDEDMTAEEIAGMYKVSESIVRSKLFQLNISKAGKLEVNIGKEDLIELYINQDLTQAQIAKKYNCATSSVMKNLRKYKIEKKSKWDYISKEILLDLYLRKNMFPMEIAEQLGCPFYIIEQRLRSLNLFDLKTDAQKEECRVRAHERRLASCCSRSKCEKELASLFPTPHLNTFDEIGKELDLFYPGVRVAIEYNGDYWHSEARGEKEATKHIYKMNLCESRKIHLINIFERFWRDLDIQPKIIHLLDNLLEPDKLKEVEGTYENISAQEAKVFLECYCLEPHYNFDVCVGTRDKDGTLLNVMAFKVKGAGQYRLSSFATKFEYREDYLNLFNYFKDSYSPNVVEASLDKRYYNDRFLSYLGLTHIRNSKPDFTYVYGSQEVSRVTYKKSPEKYEKFYKVHDCGRSIWKYEK